MRFVWLCDRRDRVTSAGLRLESFPCPLSAAMDQLCPGCCVLLHRADVWMEGAQGRACASIDPRETLLLYQLADLRTLRAENAELSRALRKALVRARSCTPGASRSLDASRTRAADGVGKAPPRTPSCPQKRERHTHTLETEGM